MNATSILLLLVFVAAGYVLQPMLLPRVGRGEKLPEVKATTEKGGGGKKDALTEDEPTAQVVDVDLSLITSQDFPEKVTLLESAQMSLPGVVQPVVIDVGTDVVPVALQGEMLLFQSPGFAVQGKVHVGRTNFLQRVKPILEERLRKESAGQSEPEIPEVSKVPEGEVAPVPSEPEPEATPEPEPPVELIKLDAGQMVEAMKRGVRDGKMEELKVDGITSWKKQADEEIDGQTYQVGLVEYEAVTILGEQKQLAKALFHDGKLVKWVWATTGVEVR